MISYGKQSIDQSDIDSVVNVLKSDWLTQGPAVEKFENDLKKYFGSKYVCAVSNGTAALHLSAIGLDWGLDDIIITSPLSFLATANCIIYANATPDFCDIDSNSYTIDPNHVEDKIKKHLSSGNRVKSIIGVDFAGHPCDWKSLKVIADKYDLTLVNDNCHALGASYSSNKQYAIKYADIVIQSYHAVKHISTGEGGAILTNSKKIDQKVRCLRTHGMTKSSDLLEKNDGPWYYEMHSLGYNYRITDFQCALGSNQLKKLNDFVSKRNRIAKYYDKAFRKNKHLKIPSRDHKVNHSYHLYPLQIFFDRCSKSKKELFDFFYKHGINLQVHYIPISSQPYYVKKFGINSSDYINANLFYSQEVSLPIYPTLEKKSQDRIIKLINELV
ncbi:MAG: UDP-4-amino-4,6-dideoxy-N-acetyl-beta-L-altrosamine transaminase [Candidatus Marinimicrobia bacterium]|nr:UDP-4-amino-4,6-dideoxy-N-acetyl-beta-L-altrosamine transaminase [Candidatus Neomarinimicrobiota bacterium]|tara:strand:+ start:17532 stop:18689 length:1158 start_codon:yes stop_codon:yes gene_type:complete